MDTTPPATIGKRLVNSSSPPSKIKGFSCLLLFVLCVPLSNWLILNVGTTCVPGGPCLIPVAPGVLAPSGVLTIGIAFVLRDIVQEQLGFLYSVGGILLGTILSATFAPPELAIASASAFFVAELLDLLVYTPLRKRYYILAVLLSGLVGSAIDSYVFLMVAFGSTQYFFGQFIGKSLMVIISAPLAFYLRRVVAPNEEGELPQRLQK